MEEKDLVVGRSYTQLDHEELLLKFIGEDGEGGLTFEPMNSHTKNHYWLYDKKEEQDNPMYKEGYVGFSSAHLLVEVNANHF